MTYGTSGIGSRRQSSRAKLFRLDREGQPGPRPYKGGGPAMSDLLGGQIPSVFASATTATPQVKAASCARSERPGQSARRPLPEVPTIAEQGYPGYQATELVTRTWRGENPKTSSPAEPGNRQDAERPGNARAQSSSRARSPTHQPR